MNKKRGQFFTIDAILAASILVVVILLVSTSYISEPDKAQVSFMSQDMVRVFTNLKVSELDNDYVKSLINSGIIKRANNTILEQIGAFWAEGETELAKNFARNISDFLIPGRFGFGVYVDREEIYVRSKSVTRNLISSRKILSGITRDRPIEGFTSRAFLKRVRDSKISSFVYFGGFVGQGNITVFIDDVPKNVTLKDLYLELDAGSDFNLFINNDQCLGTFIAGTGQMTADNWNISDCLPSFIPDAQNNFTISFLGEIGTDFVGGGFIKVSYTPDEILQFPSSDLKIKRLPGIKGIINLYSSFFVPGTLNHMEVYLHYFVEPQENLTNPIFLAIGNETVLRILNTSGEFTVKLNDNNLTPFLEYLDLSLKTVPIRLGFENVSYATIFEGIADVGIITDISGSMNCRMDYPGPPSSCAGNPGVIRDCDDPLLDESDTQRLSVAKCLDKQFAKDIINTTGNKVGLIAFESSTESTVPPTTNLTNLNNSIITYTAGGGTCICCGINSASDILIGDAVVQTLISAGETWRYNVDYFFSQPPDDAQGDSWYEVDYDDSSWSEGAAILGATNDFFYNPVVNTEIGSDLGPPALYADLWEHGDDNPGAPNDFSSGILNSTANTYGLGAGDDGWDSSSGVFDYAGAVTFDNIVSGQLRVDSQDNNQDVSGAYGIEFTITQEMVDLLANGQAVISFDWAWDDRGGFESSDQVWVKAMWISPTGTDYLGSNLDTGMDPSDPTEEIYTDEDPDGDTGIQSFSQSIGNWIEGAGTYYLAFGGKLKRDNTNEGGRWMFDNVELKITNLSNHYYFRKHFTITDLSVVKKGILNVLSDDNARVYLNDVLIDSDAEDHLAEYWNIRGKSIEESLFKSGDNVIAVDLVNADRAAKFNLELRAINDSRDKAMMVMTDGEATASLGCPQTGTHTGKAIQAACDAREDYGITVYAVGYSDEADEVTLQEISECGNGIFAKSDNVSELQEFYSDVATSILSASRHSQAVVIEGGITEGIESILYDDSYIELNYTPIVNPPQPGEIPITFEEKNFLNCSFNVLIPEDARITDAWLTSYSSEHWTDLLIVNDNIVYNLSEYHTDYTSLGDPFIIEIPPPTLQLGVNNSFFIRTGDNAQNATGCSLNNTFIYTRMIKVSSNYSIVQARADGCIWTIETEDSTFIDIPVPPTYTGEDTCTYSSATIAYDVGDSIDQATFGLLSYLDFDQNGKINFRIDKQDLEIEISSLSEVPSLWGPAIVEVRVWE